jgi:hypothetical protein
VNDLEQRLAGVHQDADVVAHAFPGARVRQLPEDEQEQQAMAVEAAYHSQFNGKRCVLFVIQQYFAVTPDRHS